MSLSIVNIMKKMEEFKSAELTVLPALLQKKEMIKAKLTTNLNIEDKFRIRRSIATN